ncbi:MAG: ribonuclease D, partial [Alphaproteobacteria bacterium]
MKKERTGRMEIRHYWNDLPTDFSAGYAVAVDTEAMGLRRRRDRLCLVQLSFGDGICHLVQFSEQNLSGSPRLKKLLEDPAVEKIFHFARFDVALLYNDLNILCQHIYCTKIASRLARTYTDRHGLKDLCRDLLSVDLS